MGKHGLSITYENNRKVYAPADVVRGAVVLDLKKAKKIKKIKVNAVGESVVKLKTPDGKHLRNREKYFHYTFDVYAGSENELAAGKHTFPFQFNLKPRLPTSYEGTLGHVRYSVQGIVEYSGMLSSKAKSLSAFTVLDTVDLNALTSSRVPQRMQCEKKPSGMCCWHRGGVTVDVTTEKTGYVPGEFIYVNGLIVNGRTKPIRGVIVELWQQVTFYGRVKNSPPNSAVLNHKVSSSVAMWAMSTIIDEESAENWNRKQLFQIPPLIPSGLRNCSIIDVQYYLKISVNVPSNLSSSVIHAVSNFITIGNVPLAALPAAAPQQQPGFAPQYNVPLEQPHAPIIASAPFEPAIDPSAPPPPYDPGDSAFASVPLPSYEEAVTGGGALTSDDADNDEPTAEVDTPGAQFTPQYAFFDYSRPMASLNATAPPAN